MLIEAPNNCCHVKEIMPFPLSSLSRIAESYCHSSWISSSKYDVLLNFSRWCAEDDEKMSILLNKIFIVGREHVQAPRYQTSTIGRHLHSHCCRLDDPHSLAAWLEGSFLPWRLWFWSHPHCSRHCCLYLLQQEVRPNRAFRLAEEARGSTTW